VVRRCARRVREGRWQRLYPAVYLLASHRDTAEARVWAAWLWGGGYVAGLAAAWCHGFLDRALQRHLTLDRLQAAHARMANAHGVVAAGSCRPRQRTAPTHGPNASCSGS